MQAGEFISVRSSTHIRPTRVGKAEVFNCAGSPFDGVLFPYSVLKLHSGSAILAGHAFIEVTIVLTYETDL